MPHFSLVIIGSGSGNVVVPKDRSRGPVALIESGAFGGTCINRGCIPSKILIQTAQVAAQVRHAPEFGIEAKLTGVDWPAIRDRTFTRTDWHSAAGRRSRAESDAVTLIEGRARFTGPHELAIDDGSRVTADQIVLATGARPVIPAPIAESGVSYHTSDTVMRLDELPASMIIVGGGYIAAEFAHLFSGLGVSVRVVSKAGVLLDAFDPEVSGRFTRTARDRWDVRLSAEVAGARQRGDQIEVEVTGGPPVTGELLLVAAGRVPDTADLDLDRAGVRLRDDGRIEVDAFGRTTAEGIWSLGDASTPYPLKHVANAEARTLAHNLAFPGDLRPYPHDWVPSAVFTEPQIATVGAREQDLSGKRPYVAAVQEYADVAYGWALEDHVGFCKLYADPATGTLLGAHIMGDQASLLIQPLIQGAVAGQRVADLARGQYWIHPALSEVVENALLKLRL
jgi:mycothione reductase